MRAIVYDSFGGEPRLSDVTAPIPSAGGALVRVAMTGICRSDVHAWQGHDSTVALPHIGGHEFVGTVTNLGRDVRGFEVGERVTAPFVWGCGRCTECTRGRAQTCLNQRQPGFTQPGSFAEYVAVENAEINLIRVPDSIDDASAALLGCRFATAYRALALQCTLAQGATVVVIGCGGVGLSAILIARALGARVIGVDVAPAARAAAERLGAEATLDPSASDAAAAQIRLLSDGGADVAIEALGRPETVALALASLRPGGTQVQIGLLSEPPVVDVPDLVARELKLIGSHGLAARDYAGLLEIVARGVLTPSAIVTDEVGITDIPHVLSAMASGTARGVTVARIG